MKVPSDAQAALLSMLAERAEEGETVEWLVNVEETGAWRGYRTSMAVLYVEEVDRERNVARFHPTDHGTRPHRISTLKACLRRGWFDGAERPKVMRSSCHPPKEGSETWWLKALELTEDGRIALGLWQERKLKGAPSPLPALSEREREIVELAQRALDLGYALCAREPARKEARQMRNAGWWDGCWVANSVTGLVPSSLAVVEVFPARADSGPEQTAIAEGVM